MSRQRVYFFNRFFWPDNSATAQILTDLCRDLDKSRFAVTVVTSRLNYGDESIVYAGNETFEEVEIRRLWSTRFGRGGLAGRLSDYITIYISFFVFMLLRVGANDIAVFKTDPPLLSIPGAAGKLIKRFRMVAWCQDIFPEVASIGMHVPRGLGWMFSFLAKARDWSLRIADDVVVLGQDMARFLESRGIERDKLTKISNWSVQNETAAIPHTDLRKEWSIPPEAFVVGYSGNLGRAHDWQTLLEAAKLLREESNLRFLCCGGGHGYEALRKAVLEEDIQDSFYFNPYQPLERLGASLKVPDIHWLTLKEAMTPFIFPSKFFGILQAERPVLFIGSTKGEISELIAHNEIGRAVEEGDARGLARAIADFKNDKERVIKSGTRARLLWENNFQKPVEIAKWNKLLGSLSASGGEDSDGQ